MVFSSLLFVFLFLPLNLLIYYSIDDRYKNTELLIFSLIFYAWGGPRYLILLLVDTAISWFCGIMIEQSDRPAERKRWMVLAILGLLGMLFFFKYFTFIQENMQMILGVPDKIWEIALPIGISFYTFQLLSYVVDVYWGEVPAQHSYKKLLLYSSLFHQCIAGPIVRYETVAEEIDHRKVSSKDLYYGIRRFSIGLAKKAVLTNSCAAVADVLLPVGAEAIHAQTTMALWLGMIFYTLEIYLDFSAYSDMAIGMGRMVGFHYLENFNYPYIANSVQDFWRRWHMSLSSFFRDYVYIPLGGSRCSTGKYIRNMAVVWFLTGMWHGAKWNFIFWGLYYLVFLLLERFVIQGRIPKGLDHIYTMIVVIFGWAIFRNGVLAEKSALIFGMLGIGTSGFTGLTVKSQFMSNIFLMLFCFIACTPFFKGLRSMLGGMARGNRILFKIYTATEMLLPAILLILSMMALIGDSYNPFLYFQF